MPEDRIDEALKAIDRGDVRPGTLSESARQQNRLFGREPAETVRDEDARRPTPPVRRASRRSDRSGSR